MATRNVTTAEFDSVVLGSAKPVIVDFWAEWCGPCRMVSPVLEELSNDYAEKIDVVKVNVDENPDLAMRFQITGIPSIIAFKNGQAVKMVVGAKPKQGYEADFADLLA